MSANDGKLYWLRYAHTYVYRIISGDLCLLCTIFLRNESRVFQAVEENIVVLGHDTLGTTWSGGGG